MLSPTTLENGRFLRRTNSESIPNTTMQSDGMNADSDIRVVTTLILSTPESLSMQRNATNSRSSEGGDDR